MLARSRRDGECLVWVGYRNPRSGYGQITLSLAEIETLGVARIVTLPRLMCWLENGPPPPGHGVLHSCDTAECFEPTHLRWGTQAENNADAWERTRRRGENHPNARYSDAEVIAVLRDVRAGMPVTKAAERNSVPCGAAYNWVRGGRPHAHRALAAEL